MKAWPRVVIALLFLGSSTLFAGISAKGGDGSSIEQAVVILGADSEMAGVASEDAWLRRQYPGWRKTSQALFTHESKHFDLIEITSAKGEKKNVYFDVTDFFGKAAGM